MDDASHSVSCSQRICLRHSLHGNQSGGVWGRVGVHGSSTQMRGVNHRRERPLPGGGGRWLLRGAGPRGGAPRGPAPPAHADDVRARQHLRIPVVRRTASTCVWLARAVGISQLAAPGTTLPGPGYPPSRAEPSGAHWARQPASGRASIGRRAAGAPRRLMPSPLPATETHLPTPLPCQALC